MSDHLRLGLINLAALGLRGVVALTALGVAVFLATGFTVTLRVRLLRGAVAGLVAVATVIN